MNRLAFMLRFGRYSAQLRSLVLLVAMCAAGCDQLATEDLVIEQGEYGGLRIGQSKDDVLQALRRSGVSSVHPDLVFDTVVRAGSLQLIGTLENADGICIDNGRGYSARVSFDAGNTVQSIDLSPKAESNSLGIVVSQARIGALTLVKDALIADRSLSARSCLPKGRWIQLSQLTTGDIGYLRGFDAWSYNEAKDFSYATVVFWSDRLLQIQYHKRPFEET